MKKTKKHHARKIASRCSTKNKKPHKILSKMSVLEFLPDTVKGLQAIRLATLLKRETPAPVF